MKKFFVVIISLFTFMTIYAQNCDLTGFISYSHGGYKGSGTPSQILQDNFAAVFPDGILIEGNGNSLKLTTSEAVNEFMKVSGTSVQLNGTFEDPEIPKGKSGKEIINKLGGILGAQLVTAIINVEFERSNVLGTNPLTLGDLVYTKTDFKDLTIDEFLNIAKAVYVGSNTEYSFSDVSDAAEEIILNFHEY